MVDDDVETAELAATLLQAKGNHVVTAYDGPSALRLARTCHPEVILLDIGLPGMDGYEVARQLRGDKALKDVLLIAVSGYGQERDRELSRQAGFDYHLVKPVNMAVLAPVLQQRSMNTVCP